MRGDRSRRLTILSETEKLALYGRPDFDDFQRAEFFAMTNAERSLALRRNGLEAQVYCLAREFAALWSSLPTSASMPQKLVSLSEP